MAHVQGMRLSETKKMPYTILWFPRETNCLCSVRPARFVMRKIPSSLSAETKMHRKKSCESHRKKEKKIPNRPRVYFYIGISSDEDADENEHPHLN